MWKKVIKSAQSETISTDLRQTKKPKLERRKATYDLRGGGNKRGITGRNNWIKLLTQCLPTKRGEAGKGSGHSRVEGSDDNSTLSFGEAENADWPYKYETATIKRLAYANLKKNKAAHMECANTMVQEEPHADHHIAEASAHAVKRNDPSMSYTGPSFGAVRYLMENTNNAIEKLTNKRIQAAENIGLLNKKLRCLDVHDSNREELERQLILANENKEKIQSYWKIIIGELNACAKKYYDGKRYENIFSEENEKPDQKEIRKFYVRLAADLQESYKAAICKEKEGNVDSSAIRPMQSLIAEVLKKEDPQEWTPLQNQRGQSH